MNWNALLKVCGLINCLLIKQMRRKKRLRYRLGYDLQTCEDSGDFTVLGDIVVSEDED